MTVCFCGIEAIALDKQERVAKLVDERVTLLIGKKYSSYVNRISFCKNFENCEDSETDILIGKQALIQFNSLDTQRAFVHVHLNEQMLLGLLTPGQGQAEFDELFLLVRNELDKHIHWEKSTTLQS